MAATPPRWQVEGCGVDLSSTKPYYCRHKVCIMHVKVPIIDVVDIEQQWNGHYCHVQLGYGGISTDYLATIASLPNPDDKIRSLTLKVQGCGKTGRSCF
jgi:hypothetical protein